MLQRIHNEAINFIQEHIMLNVNIATHYANPFNAYLENLGHAARSFIAALLARETAKVEASPLQAATPLDKAASTAELNRLAREFDSIMPNQAAELRYLSSRD